MICVVCGNEINVPKERHVPIAKLEFRPFIGGVEPGQDNLSGLDACQDCYKKILANRAKAIAEYGKIEDKNAQ